MTELSNWGRWGKEDQMGTVNLITPAKRKEAAALVKEGVPLATINTVSYGEERPVCTEANEACYQRNRRAHFSAGQ